MTTKRKELTEAVPRRELNVFDEMDRMFDTFLHRGWLRPFRDLWPEWTGYGESMELIPPRVDLVDREDEFLVRAEVPGVDKKDLHVDLTGNLLVIKGERHHEEKAEKGEVYRAEIARGSFSRTIRLPEEVDFAKANATFKDGLLEIRLPKTHKTERFQIKVD